LVASLPIYSVAVHFTTLFQSRYFFPVMPAVILLAAATLWGTALVAVWLVSRLIGLLGSVRPIREAVRRRDSRRAPRIGSALQGASSDALTPRRITVAILLAVGAFAVFRIVVATSPASLLTIELSSDSALRGSVSADADLPLSRDSRRALTPDDVEIVSGPGRDTTLTITPLGPLTERSEANEVWVLGVRSQMDKIDLREVAQGQLPGGWREQDGVLVTADDEPEPLVVPVRVGNSVAVEMISHPWSGGVRIQADGAKQDVDLYNRSSGRRVAGLILPVSLDDLQRLKLQVPVATKSVTLRFTGEPGEFRLRKATLSGSQEGSWRPTDVDALALGPGFQKLATTRDVVTLRKGTGAGEVTINLKDEDAQRGTLWLSLLSLVVLSVAFMGALSEPWNSLRGVHDVEDQAGKHQLEAHQEGQHGQHHRSG
jgi:hypothetical protein